jgi:hypothetical protein
MTARWFLIGTITAIAALIGVGMVLLAAADRDAELAERESEARAEIETFEPVALPTVAALPTPVPVEEGPPADTDPSDDVLQAGDFVFVSRVPGEEYGQVERLHPDGERERLGIECDRVHAGGGLLLCLGAADGIVPAGDAKLLSLGTPALEELWWRPTGRPSRARVAADGSYAAFTAFVAGHSYLEVGEFSTETIVATPAGQFTNAEFFGVDSDDDHYRAIDGNWWGVSHIPGSDGEVVATFGAADRVEVLRIDIESAVATPLLSAGGCPSISPDGRHLVAKRPDPSVDVPAALVLFDLETGEDLVLAEDRFVDDQVEWLDDDTIVYAISRGPDGPGADQPARDIWSLDLAPGAEPELLVPFADSPVIYRDTRVAPAT